MASDPPPSSLVTDGGSASSSPHSYRAIAPLEREGHENDERVSVPILSRVSFDIESDGSVWEPGSDEETSDEHQTDLVPEDNALVSSTKKSASSALQSWALIVTRGYGSQKRPSPAFTSSERRPLKRIKGPFNREYLALLNDDIEDATAGYIPHQGIHLPPSQAGMVSWTTAEKELLFEALSRLGPDALAISRRVRTKDELEVRQYLELLQTTTTQQMTENPRVYRSLQPNEISATVEIGPECCFALEQAADALSLRQEAYEQVRECAKWGGDQWLVNRANVDEIAQHAPSSLKDALGLFPVANWLALSERIFMNSVAPENNWLDVAAVPDERPAIWLTALANFHALTVSILRRLVAATIFVSESRTQSKRAFRPTMKAVVSRRDVDAAVHSLGMISNSRAFWAGCARRIGLDVYKEPPRADNNTSSSPPRPMSYASVEAALGNHHISSRPRESKCTASENIPLHHSGDESSSSSCLSRALNQENETHYDNYDISSLQPSTSKDHPSLDEEEILAIKREVQEVLLHTALHHPPTSRIKKSLWDRIRSERRQEAFADASDMYRSVRYERRIWRHILHASDAHYGPSPSNRNVAVEEKTESASASADEESDSRAAPDQPLHHELGECDAPANRVTNNDNLPHPDPNPDRRRQRRKNPAKDKSRRKTKKQHGTQEKSPQEPKRRRMGRLDDLFESGRD